jgi:predicted glycosyltransferase
VAHVLFSSHDGYGLGHVRRNSLIADALLAADPTNRVTIVTGVARRPRWTSDPRVAVVAVPPLLKDGDEAPRTPGTRFEEAIRDRALAFRAAVRAELAGEGWRDVARLFDEVLVYGEQALCDHELEYGLPVPPTYCGWVCPPVERARPTTPRLVISAGGGGDGAAVYRLGLQTLLLRLSALGLADTVDEHAHPGEVAWLLDRSRLLDRGAVRAAGIRLDGAQRVARHIQRGPAAVPQRRLVLAR